MALKSSVKMSGDATSRTSPPLSPVNEGSNARATKPRLASSLAYRPDDCSFTAPNGPLTARAGSLPDAFFGTYRSPAISMPKRFR